MNKSTRSKELLNKVYNHLDTIDVTKLSMDEMKDFLEVVREGQFLESFGQMPSFRLGAFNGPAIQPDAPNANAEIDVAPDAK